MAERYQELTQKLVDKIEKFLKASREAEVDTDINIKINADDTAEMTVVSCGVTRREKIKQPLNP